MVSSSGTIVAVLHRCNVRGTPLPGRSGHWRRFGFEHRMHLGKTGTNRSHCGEYAFRTYRGNGVGTFCSTLFVGSRATGTCANPENGDFGSRPLEAVPLSSVNDTGSVS